MSLNVTQLCRSTALITVWIELKFEHNILTNNSVTGITADFWKSTFEALSPDVSIRFYKRRKNPIFFSQRMSRGCVAFAPFPVHFTPQKGALQFFEEISVTGITADFWFLDLMATIRGNLKVLWKGETACFSSFSVYRVGFRDLSDKSMDFWMKTDSICLGKPCNTWAPTILERFNPFQTFERINKIPERHVLARNPSPFCLQIGGTRNVRFGAPVKLGLEIFFTCLGVYILRKLRVSVFADWWRPYNAFQGFRFEVYALAIIWISKL